MIKLLVAAAVAAFVATPSAALTFAFNYTSTNAAAPLSASGFVTTSNTLNAAGGYSVLGITGTVDGDIITALTVNPSAPFAQASADGLFTYDNNFYTAGAYVSGPGLLFTSAGGFEYNLFSDSPTQYELYKAIPNVGYVANSIGTLSAAAVPEPASWAMLVMGFGIAGASVRRRRQATVSA